MAGLRGGKIGSERDRLSVGYTHDLMSGRIGTDELRNRLTHQQVPKTVTLVVNNFCNLACQHCYLQVEKLTADALSVDEWKKLTASILAAEPELICLSGKEVFLGRNGTALIEHITQLKRETNSSSRMGVITNGTLIEPHRDLIERADFSYFDISIDGAEARHDAVRGKGAFAQLRPNLEWASQTLGSRFFVSQTFQKHNFRHLRETIEMLDGFGVQNLGCGFYRPLSYTDQDLVLTDEDIASIFADLPKLASIPLDSPKVVLFELDVIHMPALLGFLGSDWFDRDSIVADRNGQLYVEHTLKNGLKLQFRFSLTPSLISDSSRITPEGNYLAADDTIDTSKYAEYSLGNARDHDFDFAGLHLAGTQSERIEQILQTYGEFTLPVLRKAFEESFSSSLIPAFSTTSAISRKTSFAHVQ